MSNDAAPAVTATTAEARRADITRQFRNRLNVIAWYGPFTGHWWAVADGYLVEAAQPGELAQRVRYTQARFR
ncbi:hypothetical protein Acsp03_62020 [Actinomadura sp. NBRC 104412]|uniref:hypothetical protein n=1 Tax=Actinomadura sp. NBRC 104412 TaxID=3032203 RepID=UPI00249FA120|nr:hypothetical protein [Actinomadura sp. NBRC 104412]GLZ08736.1 hypothetical protein Acsp03_62020 [Actinomadura sp. NBRC 104412]